MQNFPKTMLWLAGAIIFAFFAVIATSPQRSVGVAFRLVHTMISYREEYLAPKNNISSRARALLSILRALIPPERLDTPTDIPKARQGTQLIAALIPARSDVVSHSLRIGGALEAKVLLVAPATAGPLRSDTRLGRVVLWFHGGGFICGSPEMERSLAAELAVRSGAAVLLASYRQAPEHTLADALADALAVFRYVTETRAVASARLVLGGSSAGALLALMLAQRLVEQHMPQPAGLWLQSLAPFDYAQLIEPPRWASVRAHTHQRDPALSEAGWHHMCAAVTAAANSTALLHLLLRSPANGLPHTLLSAGGNDLLLSGIEYHHQRLKDAGVPVVLRVRPHMPHGYPAWAALLPEALDEIQFAASWIADRTPLRE